jgi:hypothetical protein
VQEGENVKESISSLRTILRVVDPGNQPNAFRYLRDRLDDAIGRKLKADASAHPSARNDRADT